MSHATVYEEVTQKIIEELEQGTAPWVKPWQGGVGRMPYNATSQRRYSGVNVLLLWSEAFRKGYRHHGWLTFKQARALGGHVKKGEHGCHVVYASSFTKHEQGEDGEEQDRKIPFLKSYTVFNVAQTERLPSLIYAVPEKKPLDDAIEDVEVFLARIGADVRHGGDRACYMPGMDAIALPEPSCFETAAHYYATSLHEHTHWSGAKHRLNRDLTGRFGDAAYAAEELVAELSAAFLCASLSIPGRLRHAEYLGSWLKVLQEDKKAIFTAASRATEAAQFLEAGGSHAGEGEAA
jgi:antirestriction protein ArdC